MESIDDLLAQVKAEYQEQNPGVKPKKKPLVPETEIQSPPPMFPTYQSPSPCVPKTTVSLAEDSLLAEVRAEFEEQERTEELKRQQQLREEQLRQEQQLREEQLRAEQRRRRRREALAREATEWLKKLNPRSEEGLWFEEFSYSYPSKLEAAIDYLEALRETQRQSGF
jgi:multidrug efflux pump subunit AcrA (membrane-fusion protein)